MCPISPREPVAVPAPVLLGSVLHTRAAGISAAALWEGLWGHWLMLLCGHEGRSNERWSAGLGLLALFQ